MFLTKECRSVKCLWENLVTTENLKGYQSSTTILGCFISKKCNYISVCSTNIWDFSFVTVFCSFLINIFSQSFDIFWVQQPSHIFLLFCIILVFKQAETFLDTYFVINLYKVLLTTDPLPLIHWPTNLS